MLIYLNSPLAHPPTLVLLLMPFDKCLLLIPLLMPSAYPRYIKPLAHPPHSTLFFHPLGLFYHQAKITFSGGDLTGGGGGGEIRGNGQSEGALASASASGSPAKASLAKSPLILYRTLNSIQYNQFTIPSPSTQTKKTQGIKHLVLGSLLKM